MVMKVQHTRLIPPDATQSVIMSKVDVTVVKGVCSRNVTASDVLSPHWLRAMTRDCPGGRDKEERADCVLHDAAFAELHSKYKPYLLTLRA